MGLIHFQRRNFERAQDAIWRALKINPRSIDALTNFSFVLQAQGKHEEALRYLDNALKIQPTNLLALNNRGNLLWLLKRHEDALESLNKALSIKSDYADALCNRGIVLIQLQRFDEALRDFDAALRLSPRDPIVLNNRANVLWALDRHDEALQTYEKAFAIDPQDLSILKDRGAALLFAEREQDALDCFDRALAIKADEIHSRTNAALCSQSSNRFEEALACFDKSLEVDAANVDALNGRGNALASLTRAAEAIAAYNKAIEIDPETPEVRWNRSLAFLQVGDFKEGWKEFEWRWKTANFTTKPRNFDKPLWLGDSTLQGKTILIHAEQGFGDSIQFCRYIPMVAAQGAQVIVEAQAPLKGIFSSIKGASEVIAFGEELPPFDLHCPMLSLPLAFKTELDFIPHGVPYLAFDQGRKSKFADLLPQTKKKLIGLAWAGRPTSFRSYTEWDTNNSFEELKRRLIKVARICIEEDGAEVIVLGGGPLVGYGKLIEAELGIPVIDPTLATFKLMESVIDLGHSHSKIGRWKAPLSELGDTHGAIPYNRAWLDKVDN